MARSQELKLLSPGQIRLLAFVVAAAGFMIANSLYLALAGRAAGVGDDPHRLSITYQVMLALHILVGVAVFGPALVFAFWHLKKALLRKSRGTVPTGIGVLLAMTIIMVTGFFILTAANTRDNQWAFISHQVLALLLPFLYLAHRRLSFDPPSGRDTRTAAGRMLGLVVLIGLVHGVEATLSSEPVADRPVTRVAREIPDVWRDPPVDDPFIPFVPEGDVDPRSPFFPAATTTSSGGPLPARIIHHDDFPDREAYEQETRERGFAPSHYLGAQTCQRCHPDSVEQWATSAHRFASFNNPFYRKAVELTRDETGRKESQWCGGCHDPAIMLAGNMENDIDPVSLDAQAGLTCLACHAIDETHGLTGNGNYNIQDESPSPYMFSSSKEGLARVLHDYAMKAKPTVHKRRMLKPFFRESQFCMPCHKVSLDVPVNDYRWLRGQNEFDAWHNSGVARNNPMTWYEPEDVRQCQDCHMPLEEAPLGDVAAKGGKIRSHRFLAVNTALPYIRGDMDTIKRMEAYLQDQKLSVDIFALRRNGEAPVMAVDRRRPALNRGDQVQLDIVVRNLGVGHTFPGGTNDSNQGWIELTVATADGVLFQSGAVREDRRVDPAAHFYRSVLVDKHGQRIAKRNAPDIHTAVYANVIPPSGSDLARYTFTIPEDTPLGELTVKASLKWRKFTREYTEFVFEGVEVPDLPITTIASDAVTVTLGDDDSEPDAREPSPDDWKRFNDYGVALALDGVTKEALTAFEQVARMVPDRPDGWRNQARQYLVDGDFDACERMLRKATEAAPEDYKNAFWWGRLFEERGGASLEDALVQFRAVTEMYPDSRDTWARLGRTLMHLGRYEEAIKAFLQVLRIDPEHALAHEKRSEAYGSLAEQAEDPRRKAAFQYASGEARRAYLKYKIDEDAQKATLSYRDTHPHDHRMCQRVVIHELTPQ